MSDRRLALRGGVIAAISLAAWLLVGGNAIAQQPRVMGWIERARIFPGGLTLVVKLDTGAKTSSIDVKRYEEFKRDGKTWLRFSLSDRKGGVAWFERPVIRISRIRRSGAPTVTRPVVTLGVCLGGLFRETQVNLADRAHLKQPMLIGRRFLEGGVLVDPARTFTADPRCGKGHLD